MKILLFDDHQFVLQALNDFLKAKPDVQVVGLCTTKEQVLQMLATHEVEVLVSDVLTDAEIGLTLFEEIQQLQLGVKIVVFSSISSEFVKQFLFDYGVVAILNKKEPLEKLWETLQLVDFHKKYKHQELGEVAPALTPKEQEIARYLAKGLAAKEIATLTNSAINTVNNQKNHLLVKFDCTNSTELATKLLKMGYLKI